MRRHLHLVTTTRSASRTQRPLPPSRPYDLALQPQRPGELGRELVLTLERDDTTAIERRAALAGLPTPLWSTLAVEATRSIKAVETSLDVSATDAYAMLSTAVTEEGQAVRRSRLNDYARALRETGPRDPVIASFGRTALMPGLASATAWESEADAAGVSLEDWIVDAIAVAPDGFVLWEAAAADEGRSLLEWTLVQAARRRRSASTPAQIAG